MFIVFAGIMAVFGLCMCVYDIVRYLREQNMGDLVWGIIMFVCTIINRSVVFMYLNE